MTRVLLIDDVPMSRDATTAALRTAGLDVVAAPNVAEALVAAAGSPPDAILFFAPYDAKASLLTLARLRSQSGPIHGTPLLIVGDTFDQRARKAFKDPERVEFITRHDATLDEVRHRLTRITTPETPATPGTPGAPETATTPNAAGAATKAPARATSSPAGAPNSEPTEADVLQHCTLSDGIPVPRADARLGLRPIVSRAAITDRVEREINLPAMPSAVIRILNLLNDKSCSLPQVAEAVEQDQAITLKILRLANSPIYAGALPVESVYKALLRIGLEQTRQVALTVGVIDRLSKGGHSVDSFKFWMHSITTGVLASEIVKERDEEPDASDGAYAVGLLHDVGRMVLSEMLGEEYARVVRAARERRLPLDIAESRMLLVNHAELMDRVLLRWKFPRMFVNPIAFHHLSPNDARRAAPNQINEVYTVMLADRLAHAMLIGAGACDAVSPTGELAHALGLDAQSLSEIMERSRARAQSMRKSVIAAMGLRPTSDAATLTRARLRDHFRPLFIGAQPGTDAWRCICDALGDKGGDPPNVIIAHIEHTKDRAALSTSLLHEERAERCEGLPLLILSPNAEYTLREDALAGRRHARLPSTLTLDAFADAVNAAVAPPTHAAAA